MVTKCFLTILATLYLVGIGVGQDSKKNSEKCRIAFTEAPKAGGYFLGQDKSDALAIAETHRRTHPYESLSGRMVLIPGERDKTKAAEHDSAYSVTWQFHNEKIATLQIQYLAYTPKDLSQFIHEYSRARNLPDGIFRVRSERQAEAKCQGFSIYLITTRQFNEKTLKVAEVHIVDRKSSNTDDRSYFENRTREAHRERQELMRNPRKIINPGGPVVGPSN